MEPGIVLLTEPMDGRALCVALAPELLTAVVRRGRRVLTHSEVRIAADGTHGSCERVLAALRTYLREAGPMLRGLPIALSITTRWGRLSMRRWSEALRQDDTRHRHMQFAAIYGEFAHYWGIASDDATRHRPLLAFAPERRLASALQVIALEHGNPQLAIESVLTLAARATRLAQHRAMALLEPGRLVLATLAQGRITGVTSQDCDGPWHIELPKAWQCWTERAPARAKIGKVAVLNLDGRPIGGALPPYFQAVALPRAMAPAYAAMMMTGS